MDCIIWVKANCKDSFIPVKKFESEKNFKMEWGRIMVKISLSLSLSISLIVNQL
jgi:hypothetical protein